MKPLPPDLRQRFERGEPMATLLADSGFGSESRFRDRATADGWSIDERRRAIAGRCQRHVHGDGTATCAKCGRRKPVSTLNRMDDHVLRLHTNSNARAGIESTCRACKKTAQRRRRGVRSRADISRAAEERALLAAARRGSDIDRARKELRSLVRRLFVARCAEVGERPDAIEYRVRYRTNTAFREREIVRTWDRKARASGANLRTDSRTAARVCLDGSLDRDVIAGLFAAATRCPYCDRDLTPRINALDHVLPTSRGGEHSRENVVVACKECNTRKGARTPLEWILGHSVDRSCSHRKAVPLNDLRYFP